MLPDRYRQLLTAFVDGELSARQRRHVQRLLHRSPEARRLLADLQEDSRRLRALPRVRLEADLSGAVLRAIGEKRPTPRRRQLAKSPALLPAWAGLAAAAAVLLTIGAASFWYFSASMEPGKAPAVAQQPRDIVPHEGNTPADPNPALAQGGPTPPAREGAKENPRREGPKPPAENPVVKAPPDTPLGPREPAPRPETPWEGDVLTDRLEMFRIDRVTLSLPVVLKLHHLDQETVRQQFLTELSRDRDFRLELPCRNGTRACERLQEALKPSGFALVIDPLAQARLKLPQVATTYAVYLENLTPEELARLLLRLGQDDSKAAARKPPDGQFDRLVLTRMTPQDHKELTTLLGIDPTLAAAPGSTGPLGTDPRQPLTDLTAKQVSEALAGQGGTPRPEAGKPVKAPERPVMILPLIPGRPHTSSPEIARFLENRKPARPGTLRLLLVLRG